jgi:ABC-type antimicrobial peptide transport system permease subunit
MRIGIRTLFRTVFDALSYIVAQRTTDIGIRVSAPRRGKSAASYPGRRLGPAVLGLAMGLAGSIGASQLIRSMLYGTQPLDPSVFFGVAAILLCVACAACLIPAWRASRLDPMAALRAE